MTSSLPLLVFTDLDGTLLSHSDYQWHPALPALDRLAEIGAGVVMASSKTAPEISALRDAMGLQHWAAIVENGAGLLPAGASDAPDRADYAKLRGVLTRVTPSLRAQFQGFGDMDAAQVSAATGLAQAQAELAKARAFSEPGLWSGSPDDRAAFLAALQEHGVTAREGGRFLTLSFGATKADQMAQLVQKYAPRHTIALGDAPNDIEMLQTADFGVIIANPHRAPLPVLTGEAAGTITRSTRAGPDGWNAAILAHLARLNL